MGDVRKDVLAALAAEDPNKDRVHPLITAIERTQGPNEQLGDIEFVSDVMARMPPGAEIIDPAVARLSNYTGDPINLQGYHTPADTTEEDLASMAYQFVGPDGRNFNLEAGTVNVLPTADDVNATWAHEYQHQQDPGYENTSHRQIYANDYIYAPSDASAERQLQEYKNRYDNSVMAADYVFGGGTILDDREAFKQSRIDANNPSYIDQLLGLMGADPAHLARKREGLRRQPEINRRAEALRRAKPE